MAEVLSARFERKHALRDTRGPWERISDYSWFNGRDSLCLAYVHGQAIYSLWIDGEPAGPCFSEPAQARAFWQRRMAELQLGQAAVPDAQPGSLAG